MAAISPDSRPEDNRVKEDLQRKVVNWLGDQGYPLEMRVARHFSRRAMQVVPSWYYLDPESLDYREIDVLATHSSSDYFHLTVPVECKSSPGKPWVAFSAEESQLHQFAFARQRLVSKGARDWWKQESRYKGARELPLFRSGSGHAYGATQAFTTGSDAVYSSMRSVVKAAITLKEDQDLGDGFRFAQPLIVINAPLFEAHLADSGDISVSPTDRIDIAWRNTVVDHVDKSPHAIISLVTEGGLPQFIDDCTLTVKHLESSARLWQTDRKEFERQRQNRGRYNAFLEENPGVRGGPGWELSY
ncbi:hypothetical protein [Frankia sp. EAN1pec]|uniref:hypothetical protein n=1 Tax=Parafrankia sp. (strain EAN1pec) TaxID=298653 RepID=UPI0012F773C1